MILDREKALKLLHTHIKNPRMIMHCLASEAVMRALARHFGKMRKSGAWQVCYMTLM